MKHLRIPLMLLVIAMALNLSAMAQSLPDVVTIPPEESSAPLSDWNNDDAFDGYMRQLMGIKDTGALYAARNLGGDLTGFNKVVYNKLKPLIKDVAAGRRSSTIFEFSSDDADFKSLGIKRQFTAADLGVSSIYASDDTADNTISTEAKTALSKKVRGNLALATQLRVLLSDCPFDLYWCDKTCGVTLTFFNVHAVRGATRASDYIYYDGVMTLKFSVAEEFAANDQYTFDTQIAAQAATAAKNARAVVSQYASASDYEKLKGYKDTVCDMVEYDHDAAGGGKPYGNPWQLLWVFDGDKDTNVVCEGYSKAFQYLCDMTDFESDDLWCYCVSGIINSVSMKGSHMWNTIHMPNGKNYLADITNCDSHDSGTSAIGAPDKLFMKAPASGNAQNGYVFKPSSTITYAYTSLTTDVFSTAELTLSDKSYLEDVMLVNASTFPDDNFRAYVSDKYDANHDGMLMPSEIIGVISMDVSGKSIASLAGIGYFSSLTTLDCSDNNLSSLDVSANRKLQKLNCSGNALETLDVTACSKLAQLIDPANRVSTDPKRYQSGSAVLICDSNVRLTPGEVYEDVLYLPAGLTTIEEEAFAGIPAEAIDVPDGVKSIGKRAFADCGSLSEITLPDSITYIASDAFEGCKGLLVISPSEKIREWARKKGFSADEP